MPFSELDQICRDFLSKVYERTRGDGSVQVSMYDIGDALGLDRDASSQTAQSLIGLDLVEIKTLSGGIGISAKGSETMEAQRGGGSAGADRRLSDARVLSAGDIAAVDQVIGHLKDTAGSLGLDFEHLAELVADLRTIDAQMVSTKPKTAIVRECLRSIRKVLSPGAHAEAHNRLSTLLGD